MRTTSPQDLWSPLRPNLMPFPKGKPNYGRRGPSLVGQQFNRLTVLEQYYAKGEAYCNVICSCGTKVNGVKAEVLKSNGKRSCGCLARETSAESLRKQALAKSQKALQNCVGERFSRLVILEVLEITGQRVLCQCDCGNLLETRFYYLTKDDVKGGAKSCGCKRRDNAKVSNQSPEAREFYRNLFTTHGFSHHPLWDTWKGIISRCFDLSDPGYGGRGITVCERYQDFALFIEDMGDRPPGLTIDRENNDGGYWCGKCEECLFLERPKNVRWATWSQQNKNRRPFGSNRKVVSL